MKRLEDLVEEIRQGAEVDPQDLIPHLCREQKADRYEVNAALAGAYLESGRVDRARVFAERAWLLSGFSEDFLPLYVEVQGAANGAGEIQEAHKRVGMKFAAAGNIVQAINHFNLSHYAYQRAGRGDTYEYDFDILDKIEEMARPHRVSSYAPLVRHEGDKIRVAYLVFGATHSESVLIKLLCYFARFHDPKRFDTAFFVPDRIKRASLEYNELRKRNIDKLESQGARVVAVASTDELQCLFDTATRISEFRPHALVTTGLLADFRHYFIRALRPAPVTIGLSFGPPQQYAPPNLDWTISATKHPLIDSPCGGSLVEIEVELPDPGTAAGYTRSDFGIPDRAVVILCAGRREKFLNQDFWKALVDVLRGHLDAFLVVVGLPEEPRFVADLMPDDARERFLRLGWRTDYIKILGLADILVDTFPSGGGVTLFDAMALGKPVVSFRNDYMRPYSQADWSPAEEWVEQAELIVERGSFDQLKAIVSRLIEDPRYRTSVGEQCRQTVVRNRGNPERMVQRHEQIYERIIAMSTGQASKSPNGKGRGVPAPGARALLKYGQETMSPGWAKRAIRYLYFLLSRFWRAR